MSKQTEFRVIGPPGCGKTTFLSREVTKAVERYGSEQVMVASLTRTAAAEVAGRDIPINPDRIGTLHAHAFRALGYPTIVEDRKHVEIWNSENSALTLTVPGSTDLDSSVDGFVKMGSPGDKHFNALNIARAQKIPVEELPGAVRRFASRWEAFKREHDGFDFTDLIETAANIWQAPGHPKVIFIDEGQDHDRLELDLIRGWGGADRGVERLVVVGDPDQNLYEWRGSEPEAFFDPPLPDDQKLVLKQSYRVPHAVWLKATEWIEQTEGREPVEYWPTDEAGEVRKGNTSLKDSPGLLRDARQYIDAGKSVMFLTTCAYMLEPLKNQMRAEGIPFHNPYRQRADWNPLNPPVRGVSTLDKFKAYISPLLQTDPYVNPWSVGDVQVWVDALARVLKRGAKKILTDMDPHQGFTMEHAGQLFQEKADWAQMFNIEAGDPGWFKSHMRAGATVDYAARVLEKFGAEAVIDEPKIQIGTIHSVKGGEADVVYLFPDVSRQGFQQLSTGRGKAATIRQFYVGMTRAKETLIIGAASSTTGVQLGR